jgi:hypothetical protein
MREGENPTKSQATQSSKEAQGRKNPRKRMVESRRVEIFKVNLTKICALVRLQNAIDTQK